MDRKKKPSLFIGNLKQILKRKIPSLYFLKDAIHRRYRSMINPGKYLKRYFNQHVGYPLNLDNPETYNEKIQWLKLNWHDPRIIKCSDKYAVRKYVKSKGLEYLLNDMIGIYDSVEEIPFNTLPDKFVLKAVHGSGWNVICENKKSLDWENKKIELHRWMKDNYYYHRYEWGYLYIKPRIICEKYIETSGGGSLLDYKIFCFNGEPRFLFVATDRNTGQTKFDFYTCEWEHIPVKNHYPNSGLLLPKPKELQEMLSLAKILAADFPHVRVDFYIESGKLIFGEMTFYHFSGTHKFEPAEYDYAFGKYFDLPEKVSYKNKRRR